MEISLNYQNIFRENLIGVLVYVVVIGLFSDYTEVITTASFSITLFVAVLMQALTFPTFALKKQISKYFKGRNGKYSKSATFFSVWGIMFFSKFIYLEAIDIVFGESVEINGFFSILIIILMTTLITTLIKKVDRSLEKSDYI